MYSFAEEGKSIEDVDRTYINIFIRNLKERKLAPTSVIRKVASIRNFFKWATSMNIIQKNPASTLEQPKVPKKLPKVVSIKEIEESQNVESVETVEQASTDTIKIDDSNFKGHFGEMIADGSLLYLDTSNAFVEVTKTAVLGSTYTLVENGLILSSSL